MNVHVVIFTCFQLTKITVYGVVLPTIPEEWRKNPKQIPFNYHNKFLYPSVSNIKLPIIKTPQVRNQITGPKIGIFTFPKKEYQNFNIPRVITQTGKPCTHMPFSQLQNQQSVDFPDHDDQIYFDETKYQENKTEHDRPNDEKSKLKSVEMFNTSKNINNNISIIPDKVEKKVPNNDSKSLQILKDKRIFSTRSPGKKKSNHSLIELNYNKSKNNKTLQRHENNKINKEANEIKNINLTANNFKEHPNDKVKNKTESKDDPSERKPFIEIIINHNNNDSPIYIDIHNQCQQEPVTPHYKIPDWNYENERQTSTVGLTEGSHQDNGSFVTNQYINPMLDTDNYVNAYQMETDTKGDFGNVFPINEGLSFNADNINLNI